MLVAALALTPTAFADVVVSSGTWQSWSVSDLYGGTGINPAVVAGTSPFWNNGSHDSPNKGLNIGHCLTTGASPDNCTLSAAPGNLQYLGSGMAAVTFTFLSSGLGGGAALKLEIAGNASSNAFGWYNTVGGAKTQIFSGSDTTGASTTFSPSASYGFYLDGPGSGDFRTGVQGQNFALFKGTPPGVWWLAIEDVPVPGSSDRDYNDMLVKITTVNVPDGGMTLMLLGGALVGMETLRRRLRS